MTIIRKRHLGKKLEIYIYIYIFRLENNRERTLQRKDRYRDYKKYIQRNIELKIKIDVQLMRR